MAHVLTRSREIIIIIVNVEHYRPEILKVVYSENICLTKRYL